jgi:hypothetical protein
MSWLAGFLTGLLEREAWAWLPHLTRAIISLETIALPRGHREVRREEWLAELEAEFADRHVAGVLWALSLFRVCLVERVAAGRSTVDEATPARAETARRVAVWLAATQVALSTTVVLLAIAAGAFAARSGAWVAGGLAVAVATGVTLAPVVGGYRRRRRERARRAHALRRAHVLRALAELSYDSRAQSIIELRAALADLTIETDLVLFDSDGLPPREVKRSVAR